MDELSSSDRTLLQQLLSSLRLHDWSVNSRTADALAQIGEKAVPSLVEALNTDDGYVRRGAATALGKIGSPVATEALIRTLQWRDARVYEDDEDHEARISAATALGRLGNRAACDALLVELEKISKSDPLLASYIIDALGEIGDRRAIPVIARSLETRDSDCQKSACCALSQMGQEGIETLLKIASDGNQAAHRYAVRVLGTARIESAVPILLAILGDSANDSLTRGEAARALGRIGKSADSMPLLLAMLRSDDDVIRSSALQGLGYLRDPEAFPAIAGQLNDRVLKYVAIIALGDLGDTRACEILIPMLQSDDDGACFHAATALGKLGCPHAIPALTQLRDRVSDSGLGLVLESTVEAAIREIQQGKVPTANSSDQTPE